LSIFSVAGHLRETNQPTSVFQRWFSSINKEVVHKKAHATPLEIHQGSSQKRKSGFWPDLTHRATKNVE
jgi:hypothetical protein